LSSLHAAKRPLTSHEIAVATQSGKFVFRDAIRVARDLALIEKAPGQRYELTPEGIDLAAAIAQDSPKEKYLLRKALLDNADFANLWRDILTHKLEVSQKSLAEDLAKQFGYPKSMAQTYANAILNFAKASGLMIRGLTPHGYVPNPSASRELKGYVQQEVTLGLYPLDTEEPVRAPERSRIRQDLRPQSLGPTPLWAVPNRPAEHADDRSQSVIEAYKLVARLGALLADKEQLESSAERAQVLKWIESLPIFTGQGPDMELLRIAKEQAQSALRTKNIEGLAFALRILHVLARRHEKTGQGNRDGDGGPPS
jgi:hypothetical protein